MRQLVRLFAHDLTASKTAEMVGLTRRSVTVLFVRIRQRITDLGLERPVTDTSWNDVRRERLVKNEMAFRDYNNRRVEIEQLQFFNPYAKIAQTKNRLPHWQQSGAVYFITFRLADAIPEGARNIEDLLAKVAVSDAAVRDAAATATYAGEPDPYRAPRADGEFDDEDEDA